MALKYLYVPSGVQEGKAYGVLPNSANADFSFFSRSSAGSRVDKNGFINTGLGLGSEEVTNGGFDSASNWNIINSSGASTQITGGYLRIQTDGAYTLVEQSNVMQSGKQYTLSYDVTESDEGSLVIEIDGGGSITLPLTTSVGSHTIDFTSQRTTLAFKRGGGALDIKIDNVSVREITEVNTDVPRLDYTGGGCPSLLLEPESTNKIGYSEDFTQSSWTKEGNPTIESNVEISPTGSLNGSYLKAPVGTNISPRIVYYFGCASGQTYTGSIFVKKDNVDYIRLLSTGATASTLNAYYNVSNGTLGTSGSPDKAKIEDYGNGWYRLSLVINTTQNTGSATFRVQLAKGDGVPTSTYDGTEKNIIFGAQLEQQPYATSYIPNYGTALGATRSADVAGSTGDLSNVVNSKEGTFMIEAAYLDSVLNRISLNNAATTSANRISVITENTYFKVFYYINNVGDSATMPASDLYENSKIAIRWKNGSITGYLNGTEGFTATNIGEFPTGILDRITLGVSNETAYFKGRVKQLRVYDEYLSDAEMAQLTTL